MDYFGLVICLVLAPPIFWQLGKEAEARKHPNKNDKRWGQW